MGDDEAGQIRDDIVRLRALLDTALDAHRDDAIFRACAQILTERKERLEELERFPLRERYVRALP